MTAADQLELGVIDRILPEPSGGAHADHDATAATIKAALLDAARDPSGTVPTEQLLATRYARLRQLGDYNELGEAAAEHAAPPSLQRRLGRLLRLPGVPATAALERDLAVRRCWGRRRGRRMTDTSDELAGRGDLAIRDLVPDLTERLGRFDLGEIEVRRGDLRVRVARGAATGTDPVPTAAAAGTAAMHGRPPEQARAGAPSGGTPWLSAAGGGVFRVWRGAGTGPGGGEGRSAGLRRGARRSSRRSRASLRGRPQPRHGDRRGGRVRPAPDRAGGTPLRDARAALLTAGLAGDRHGT